MTSPVSRSTRLLPVLLLLFIGSGCAALIYEIVWFQMHSLIVGSSAISIGVLLGTFMGGMCIGSLLLPKYINASVHPLRVYAMLEIGIALCGVTILFGSPYVGQVYAVIGGSGFFGLMMAGLFCAIFLLVPTIFMGATLPAVARWVETTPQGVAWLGFFYGGNIAGAVFGCLLAGFYLLSAHDTTYATFVAAAINVAVALVGLALAKSTAYPSHASRTDGAGTPSISPAARPVLIAIALSGATALGAEVLWTRLLSLLLGATTYTFSLIIAAILMGLGVGSSIGAFIGRSTDNPSRALAWCQILLMLGIAWGAYSVIEVLPYWPINPIISSRSSSLFEIDFVRCLWVVLPAAILWGASFPLALASVATGGDDPARLVGRVYAANTVGGILGSVITALFLLPTIGTQWSQRALIILAGIAAGPNREPRRRYVLDNPSRVANRHHR